MSKVISYVTIEEMKVKLGVQALPLVKSDKADKNNKFWMSYFGGSTRTMVSLPEETANRLKTNKAIVLVCITEDKVSKDKQQPYTSYVLFEAKADITL